MPVRSLNQVLGKEMLEVLDGLRAQVVAGNVHSLAVIAEMDSQIAPLMELRGRYDLDPHRAALAVQRAAGRVHKRVLSYEEARGFSESP